MDPKMTLCAKRQLRECLSSENHGGVLSVELQLAML